MNARGDLPGPGDIGYGRYFSQFDPEAPDAIGDMRDLIIETRQWLSIAEVALGKGDTTKARAALMNAAIEIEEKCGDAD